MADPDVLGGDVGVDVAPDSSAGADLDSTPGADAGDAFPDLGLDVATEVSPEVVDDTSGGADTAPEETGADGGPDTDVLPDPLLVVGAYDDNFGGFLRVTETGVSYAWYGPDIIEIVDYDNDTQWIVGRNTDADTWNPGLWSRIDFRVVDGGVRWCQTAFDAATEDAARGTTPADDADFDSGCGGFSWSILTPGQGPIAIAGDWADSWGSTHTISNDAWVTTFAPESTASFAVDAWDNTLQTAVAQAAATNEYNPGLWSRFDWTVFGGALYYCQTAYDAVSVGDAWATPAADATDPAATGCGGFSWTQLTPAE